MNLFCADPALFICCEWATLPRMTRVVATCTVVDLCRLLEDDFIMMYSSAKFQAGFGK